jgi:hypothetical protein
MTMIRNSLPVVPLAALVLALVIPTGNGVRAAEDRVPVTPASLDTSGRDLALTQERSGECKQGENCEYLITVTNQGPDPFTGALNILRTASYQPGGHKSADDVDCTRKRASVACRTGPLSLEAGQSFAFTLSLAVPRNQGGEVRNCAVLSFRGGELADPLEDLVTIVQLALKARGLYADGDIDGKMGKKLTAAIDGLRADEELPEGEIDGSLIRALFGASGLMVDDTDPKNDAVCDRFELPEVVVAAAPVRRRVARRRVVRRAPVQRAVQPRGFTSRNSGGRKSNHRLDGLD